MRIAVTGASGLIGTRLCEMLLQQNHEVTRLVRRAPQGKDELRWDPDLGVVDKGLRGVQTVIHLAGENIADRSWTPEFKKKILESRRKGTETIAQACANSGVSTLISASAVGFYGDTGNTIVTENSPAGTGFLADVCRVWEDSTAAAVRAGVRVAQVRLGVVLSMKGGILPRVKLPFLLGLGGALGSGSQFFPWLSLEDAARGLQFIVHQPLSGPVNLCGPNLVTNQQFTKTLGKILFRPTILSVPAFAIHAIAGELGQELLLSGQRVRPEKLSQAGFSFTDRDLESYLRAEFSRPTS